MQQRDGGLTLYQKALLVITVRNIFSLNMLLKHGMGGGGVLADTNGQFWICESTFLSLLYNRTPL